MKKQLFNVAIFASIFSMSFIGAVELGVTNQNDAVIPLVDNSGSERIVNIMSQIRHNIVPGKGEPIAYAQVTNIKDDLNIKEIAEFFDCKTVMGNAFLQETLQCPVSPADESEVVALRTIAIQALVDNPDLKQQVEKILKVAAEQEKVAMDLMSNTFKGESCPELASLELIKKQNPAMYPLINFMVRNRAWKTYNTVSTFITAPLLWMGAGVSLYSAYDEKSFMQSEMMWNSNICSVYGIYIGLLAALVTYECGKDLINAGKKRSKMHALNQLIYIAESIERLFCEQNIASQFKISLILDAQGVSLINGLKATRYEDETNYCFDTSAVHTFLFDVYESDTQLAQIFASIAEMDAYNAIATKFIEGQKSQHKFCFAHKVESAQPQVRSQGFWNVLVPNAVINSMDMNQHVILTGPNAGGKTTSIRANLQNIILAQTYGVAAAEQFNYTQFDIILSYLNISDDLVNGLSLFASEVKRAKDLLEIIKEMTPGQKLFFALDELFTGTAAEQGEKCAYEFIKKTATYERVLFVYATHFDKLKQLGKQNIGLMNYKVDAPIKNNDGKLVYPFTLSAGASTINVAEDMAKEAGLFD